jgi:hypothetical protein
MEKMTCYTEYSKISRNHYTYSDCPRVSPFFTFSCANQVDLFCDPKIEAITEYPTRLGMSKSMSWLTQVSNPTRLGMSKSML